MWLFYIQFKRCETPVLCLTYTSLFLIFMNGIFAESQNQNAHVYHEFIMNANILNISQLELIPMEYPGPPRNVSGFVIWDNDLHIFRLNLTWLPPEDVEKANGYNLTYYCIPSPCKSNHHVDSEFISDTSVTSVLLPPSDDADFISLNSSIRVLIHSVPFDEFGNRSVHFDYDVPYCISNNGSPKCHCGHMNYLPKPKLKAELRANNKINVTWTIPEKILEKNDSRYSYILVYITVSRVVSSNKASGDEQFQVIYNETLVHTLSELENEHWQELNYEFDSHAKLAASIQLWDATSCHTRTIYTEVINEKTTDLEDQHWFLMSMGAIIVSFVVLFVLLYIATCYKFPIAATSCLKSNKKISDYSDLLRSTPDGYLKLKKLRSQAIPLEMNICYVEKQIDDAKACGFVDDYEVDYRRLTFRKLVGKGAFGCVYEATAEAIAGISGKTVVAVKKFNGTSTDEAEEFLGEIAILKKAGKHPHIVTLLGCCTLKEPFCMIMEYLPHGDLNRYLVGLRNEFERRKQLLLQGNKNGFNHKEKSIIKDSENSFDFNMTRGGKPSIIINTEFTIITEDRYTSLDALDEKTDKRIDELEYILDSNELQRFALQIAEGMAHLEKKQITHRDLAARNILIDNYRNLKISDFGLSRPGIYVNTRNKKVPIRWLSIEAIRDHLYSSKSDVWAYAVVLWEIATLGALPYCTLDITKLLQYLLDGKRLEQPDNLSDEIYSIMLKCWAQCADDRPSFAELVDQLNHLTKRKIYVTFECLNPTYMFPPTEEELHNVCNVEQK